MRPAYALIDGTNLHPLGLVTVVELDSAYFTLVATSRLKPPRSSIIR